MSNSMIFDDNSDMPSFEEVVRFYGHICPGLALGYRASVAAMDVLGITRPYDEELVAVAETDACGIDAIQMVTGCTAGKGNLIVRDFGKHVFSFYARDSGNAIRIRIHYQDMNQEDVATLRDKIISHTVSPEEKERYQIFMQDAARRILELPLDQVVIIDEVEMEPPALARIFSTVICSQCNEPVADAKALMVGGRYVCLPCAEGKHPLEKTDRAGKP